MDGLSSPWIILAAFACGAACGVIGSVLASAIYMASTGRG